MAVHDLVRTFTISKWGRELSVLRRGLKPLRKVVRCMLAMSVIVASTVFNWKALINLKRLCLKRGNREKSEQDSCMKCRVLVVAGIHDRRGVANGCLRTLLPLPENSDLVLFDDNSKMDMSSIYEIADVVFRVPFSVGANGAGLYRLFIAWFARKRYDYVYVCDDDIYHSETFWRTIGLLAARKKPNAIVPVIWPEEYHRVRVEGLYSRHESVSGACILIRSESLKKCLRAVITGFNCGNHGWDWNLSNRLVEQGACIGGTFSLVQHMGQWTAIHKGVESIEYRVWNGKRSRGKKKENINGRLVMCGLLDIAEVEKVARMLRTGDRLVCSDTATTALFMEMEVEGVFYDKWECLRMEELESSSRREIMIIRIDKKKDRLERELSRIGMKLDVSRFEFGHKILAGYYILKRPGRLDKYKENVPRRYLA